MQQAHTTVHTKSLTHYCGRESGRSICSLSERESGASVNITLLRLYLSTTIHLVAVQIAGPTLTARMQALHPWKSSAAAAAAMFHGTGLDHKSNAQTAQILLSCFSGPSTDQPTFSSTCQHLDNTRKLGAVAVLQCIHKHESIAPSRRCP